MHICYFQTFILKQSTFLLYTLKPFETVSAGILQLPQNYNLFRLYSQSNLGLAVANATEPFTNPSVQSSVSVQSYPSDCGSAPHLTLAIVTSLTYITSIDMLLTTVFMVSSGSLLKPKDGVLYSSFPIFTAFSLYGHP